MPASDRAAAPKDLPQLPREDASGFLLEFEANVPEGTAESEIRDGERGSGQLPGYEVTSGVRSQVGAW
jgi:hypothetical protein